jgi:TonB family protein
VIPAEPIPPLAQPTYPRTALAKQTIPVTVGVRITVDAEGRVADVRPSMLALSIAGGSATEFERAVEEALAQWRFKPAEAQHLVPKTDTAGNEFWQVTRAEKTTWTFDVSFAFSPGGDVRAGPGK